MINYAFSVVYIILFITFLLFMATSIFNQKIGLPERIIYSYLLYKFFASFFGVIVQLLQLPFFVYSILLCLTLISLVGFSIYKRKNQHSKLKIITIIKKYGFTLVVSLLCIFFSMGNVETQWIGNHLDDGLYVNTVSDYINGIDTFNIHAATGLTQKHKFGPHSLNTWQLEAGVYAKIFHVEANVFLNFAQSFINYLLFFILIVAFIEKLLSKKELKKYEYHIQFIPAGMLLFMVPYAQLNHRIFLQDGWQFANAMFYGSTLIRTMGIFLLLLPIINKEKLGIRDGVIYIATSFILLAQSSVGLPVVSMVAIAFLLVYALFEKIPKKYTIIYIALLILAGLILPNVASINKHGIELLVSNCKSVLLYGTFLFMILGYFLKNKNIAKINTIILLLIMFVYIPQVNDIVENLSMYDFVEARYLTGLYYAMAILAFSYLVLFIVRILPLKLVIIAELMLFSVLVYGNYITYKAQYGYFLDLYKYAYNNPLLIPESTVKLGKELEKISEKSKKHLYVIAPEWVSIYSFPHSLAVLLRQYAPNSSIISAIPRYPDFSDKRFKGYSQTDCDDYTSLMNGSGDYRNLEKNLNKYPINCVVSTRKLDEGIMTRNSFVEEKEFCTYQICYYIYTR